MKRHGPNADDSTKPQPPPQQAASVSGKAKAPPALYVPSLVKDEIEAIQACWDGKATARQQSQAIKVILAKICLLYETPYIQGDDHGSAVLTGRQFCGRALMRALDLQTSNLTQPGTTNG